MGTIAVMVIQALLLALGLMLVVALLIGVAVFAHPAVLERFERVANRRVATDGVTRSLDTPHDIDRYFYRHHRLYGAVVMVLAVALLSFLAFGRAELAWQGMFGLDDRVVGQIVTETARVVLWILGLFALAIGTVVFVRPSAMKSVEARLNRWLTPGQALPGLGREYRGLEAWIRRHPRGWALAITVASALCLMALILHIPGILRLAG